MPRRDDIKTILIIGSGPIVIGQACEFDYSGVQACKALRAEGYRVVLINSNPATIMTDPAFADRTYVEPITPDTVRKIFELERDRGTPIDAVLPTLGGQTALNCACALFDDGVFEEFGVEMIGADRHVIHRAEDRQTFKDICATLNLATPTSAAVNTLDEATEFLEQIGLPAIVRPAFTLGGWGGGIAYNGDEFKELVTRGLGASMIGQVQVDKSLLGWKEYELEVVRDKNDNCVIVCGIENIDPMGVHTGDSITVAPILTLTDKEYQVLRDASLAIMREVGVETGGSNVQFAVNPNPEYDPERDPDNPDAEPPFEFVVIEMNPRVSRSSALASKATGFPIAKIAARLAVGYTLDELRNDITGTTSACFEPSIDYVVTKMPRWTFEKFPEADETLTTQMKSVGEAMAIGRTFKESLQKVIRSMEVKRFGFGLDRNDKWLEAMRAVENGQLVLDFVSPPSTRPSDEDGDQHVAPASASTTAPNHDLSLRTADGQPIEWPIDIDKMTRKLSVPSQGRLYYVRYALKMNWSIERIHEVSGIDPFFLDQMAQLVAFEDQLCAHATLDDVPTETLHRAKELGYSDAQLANLYLGEISTEAILTVRSKREGLGIKPVYKLVDTCAAEFEAITPYYYSTYQRGWVEIAEDGTRIEHPPEDEIRITDREKVIILGGGPNRIGQGIEFDYCCVHAAYAARDLGFESVMINSNPETVSTDYDTSNLLFFEPLTLEDTLNVIERLNGRSNAPEGNIFDASCVFEYEPRVSRESLYMAMRAAGIQRGVVYGGTGSDPLRLLTDDDRHFDIHLNPGSLAQLTEITPEIARSQMSESDRDTLMYEDPFRTHFEPGPVRGVVVQFGGQTPLNLASGLSQAGVPLIGTSLDSIDRAEDRDRFDDLLTTLELRSPASGIARSLDEALTIAADIGYPVLVRPSYVLGGRGMEICPDDKAMRHYVTNALDISELDNAPLLIDKFLDGAIEIDVDVVADFEPGRLTGGPEDDDTGRALVCGVMEHIEHAGVHSGDSTCTLPPYSLSPRIVSEIRDIARKMAKELRVCGLMNMQLAVKDDEVFIIEVNPRASRTVPFVGKAKGVAWASVAARAMLGNSIAQQGVTEVLDTGTFAVKAPVFPFQKFPGVDFVLGPEMRSTGEVMGLDVSVPAAYLKALLGAGTVLPSEGGVFISVRREDKPAAAGIARSLMAMGFEVYTTAGTAAELRRHGMSPHVLQKIGAGARPNVIDLMSDGRIGLVINTPTRTGWATDEGKIRSTAVRLGVPMLTTATAAEAAVNAIQALRAGVWTVSALQDHGSAPEGRRVTQADAGTVSEDFVTDAASDTSVHVHTTEIGDRSVSRQ